MTTAVQNHFTDAIVIGGGLMGLSSAFALRQQGMNVLLLEATSVARHASSASAGGVRSLNRHPAEIAMARAALPRWAALAEQLGYSCGFTVSSQMRVAEDADALDALAARAALTEVLGYSHEQLISADAMRRRIPALAANCTGALLVEDDGFADPLATVHAYRQACVNAGVLIQEKTRVLKIDHDAAGLHLHCNVSAEDKRRDIHTVEYRCHHCINGSGAWGGRISASVGEPVPVRPAALQMAVTEPIPQFVTAVVGCHGRKLSLKQSAAGAVVIGGGFEGYVQNGTHENMTGTLDQALAAENLANAIALFPHLESARVVRQWAGIEGMIADTLPVLDRSHHVPGLIHAFGFSAHGFALVPVIGPLVAAMAQGRDTELPINAFAIDRFEQHESNQVA